MEVIELLSDDDKEKTDSSDLETELSAILHKYAAWPLVKKKPNNDISPDTSEDEQETYKSIKNKLNKQTSAEEPDEINLGLDIENDKSRKRKVQNDDKLAQKLQKEQEKRLKQEERARVKAANAELKAQKAALAAAHKNLKPDECIKFITAVLDNELLSAEYSSEITSCLQVAQIKYRLSAQIVPNTVTWQWDDGRECEEVLVVLPCAHLVESVQTGALCERVALMQDVLPEKRLTLGVYGLTSYLKSRKSTVDKRRTELALAELQLVTGCSYQPLETPAALGALVVHCSKAVARAPGRAARGDAHGALRWYAAGCGKDVVHVDREGRGLRSLWRQQLTQFPLARLEAAEAVAAAYVGPRALTTALDAAGDAGPTLVRDLPVRRAAGPLSSVRQLGAALACKIHTMYTSRDGDQLL